MTSAAVATSPMTPAMRRMMKQMMASQGMGGLGGMGAGEAVTLELSPSHEMVSTLFAIRESNPEIAKISAEQLLDNTLLSAGLIDEPIHCATRWNSTLQALLLQGAGFDYVKKEYAPGAAGAAFVADAASTSESSKPHEDPQSPEAKPAEPATPAEEEPVTMERIPVQELKSQKA